MRLLTAPRSAPEIDLACCTFIDSLGVAAGRGREGDAQRDRAVAIATAKPQARRILELTGSIRCRLLLDSREAIAKLSDEQAGDH